MHADLEKTQLTVHPKPEQTDHLKGWRKPPK
jgi:hypothetical protein